VKARKAERDRGERRSASATVSRSGKENMNSTLAHARNTRSRCVSRNRSASMGWPIGSGVLEPERRMLTALEAKVIELRIAHRRDG
jgi:hypothetical protein